eukprot:10085263-Prorocentrum_lima.AAC.1
MPVAGATHKKAAADTFASCMIGWMLLVPGDPAMVRHAIEVADPRMPCAACMICTEGEKVGGIPGEAGSARGHCC